MKTRNKLLAEIVAAAGGTVTNENNRNSLLQDWLSAADNPVVCVPLWQPNGVNQCVTFDSTTLNAGDTVELWFIGAPGLNAFDRFIGSANFNFSVDTGATGGEFRFTGCTVTLDDVPIVSTVTPIPSSGAHKLVITVTVSSTIVDMVGCRSDSASYLNLPLYNFKVNDGSVINLALDDGFDNNPTAINTGSGNNGVYVNADAGAWGERCE